MIKGFFITADEMREAFIRVSNEISDHARFVPPSLAAFKERLAFSLNYRESSIADGKHAAATGDTYLEERCRKAVADIDAVLEIWRERYRACARAARKASA